MRRRTSVPRVFGPGRGFAAVSALALFGVQPAAAHSDQNVPIIGADAPELAAAGPMGVGVRTVTLVHKSQPDLEHPDAKTGAVRLVDRPLRVDIWYPADVRKGSIGTTYRATLWGEPPRAPMSFTQAGVATPNAKPLGRGHPLIILSHGYSNAPAVMTWLTENLASKGYVVAAIRHEDPNPYTASPVIAAAPHYNRPADISFVASQLRATLGPQIDPQAVALIGYSQGGYGVLTAGGGQLDPGHKNMQLVAGNWLKKIARGQPDAAAIRVPGVKAIIALAPGGGGLPNVWGDTGLAGISAPLLVIAGDQDPVVGYDLAAKSFFAQAVNSDRYLLTYKQAGHAIALNPAPAVMRTSVWDMDWFEDPIWRQDRISAINLHFITAFLALHLRGERDKRSYLTPSVEDSDAGDWAAPPGTAWGAFSPGAPEATLWKGFQRRHARGMILRHLNPMAPQ